MLAKASPMFLVQLHIPTDACTDVVRIFGRAGFLQFIDVFHSLSLAALYWKIPSKTVSGRIDYGPKQALTI